MDAWDYLLNYDKWETYLSLFHVWVKKFKWDWVSSNPQNCDLFHDCPLGLNLLVRSNKTEVKQKAC